MTYALQNACLNSCGYLTIPMVIYICTMYRQKSCIKSKIQDSQTLGPKYILAGFLRILTSAVLAIPFSLPAVLIKIEYVKNPIIIMFTNIILPIIGITTVYFWGPYDYIAGALIEKILSS